VSKPLSAEAVKLIISVLASDRGSLDSSMKRLADLFGVPDVIGAPLGFGYTDYYAPEMGRELVRRFLSFERLIRPEALPDIKISTNRIEEDFVEDGRRRINLDPGYISPAHLLLATGKGYTHRPYLRNGIYADLTLVFREKMFHDLSWTYPDYAAARQIDFFNRIRARYMAQVKQGAAEGVKEAVD